jgi:hypothetical protein
VPRSQRSPDPGTPCVPLTVGDVELIGPSMSTGPGWGAWTGAAPLLLQEHARPRRKEPSMLLSFERPAPVGPTFVAFLWARCQTGSRRRIASPRSLKTAQKPQNGYHRPTAFALSARASRDGRSDHRQDSKGTRWMPWHQESKKGVNGCDKPRLGAEWPVTRGFPNGETQRW